MHVTALTSTRTLAKLLALKGQGQGKKEGKPKPPSLSDKATVECCLEWSVVCCQIYYCENRQMLLVV